MVSLPAARAVRIYGAEISAADDMAVAATNCRRESFFRDIWHSSLVSQSRSDGNPVVIFLLARRAGRNGIARRYSISLGRSEQNCRRLSRNQVLGRTRTNVVLKRRAGRILFACDVRDCGGIVERADLTKKYCAAHVQSRCGPQVRNSAAGSAPANLTRLFSTLFFIGTGQRGR